MNHTSHIILQIYDYSIIPRITIAVLTSFFAVIAAVMLLIMLGEPKEVYRKFFVTYIMISTHILIICRAFIM